jgi:hypothetical protein
MLQGLAGAHSFWIQQLSWKLKRDWKSWWSTKRKSGRSRAKHIYLLKWSLNCGVFLWKLSFLKTLKVTSPLKRGPHGTQPLIYYTINHQNRRLLWSTLPKTNRVRVWDVKRHFYEPLFLSRSMTQNSWTANAGKWFSIHKIVLEPWTLCPSLKHISLKALRPPLSKILRYSSS